MQNIGIFVDGDNISSSEATNILAEARSVGRIVTAKVFGDFSTPYMKPWKDAASENGLIPVHCDLLKKKNSTDIRLMIEIMRILFTSSVIDIYMIVTSDSDYRHIVSEIKMRGKLCFCVGKVNASLQNICDKFIKLENLSTPQDCKFENLSTPQDCKKTTQYKNMKQKVWNKYFNDILRLSEENALVKLPKIKEKWEQKYSFDYRDWNHSNFSSFLFFYFGDKLERRGQGNEICLKN